MTRIICSATTGSDDGHIGTDTSTTINLLWINHDATADMINYGWSNIETSAITTSNIVTAATLYWYHTSYEKSEEVEFNRDIYIDPGPMILNSDAQPGAAGWKNHVLESSELSYINKSGKTKLLFKVEDPGPDYMRSWLIRSKNYPGGAMGPYLLIDYDPVAVGGPTIGFIIGV